MVFFSLAQAKESQDVFQHLLVLQMKIYVFFTAQLMIDLNCSNKGRQLHLQTVCLFSDAFFSFLFEILSDYLFIYLFNLFGCVRSQLWHAGSLLHHAGSFILARGLLSSCGVWVFSSLVVASRLQGTWALQLWHVGSRVCGLCSLRHMGSLVEAYELSSCGTRAQLPRGMWEPSSPTRDRTHVPCIGRRILYHWTTREVFLSDDFKKIF